MIMRRDDDFCRWNRLLHMSDAFARFGGYLFADLRRLRRLVRLRVRFRRRFRRIRTDGRSQGLRRTVGRNVVEAAPPLKHAGLPVSLRRSKPGKADQDPSHQASDEQSHAIPLPGDEPHFCYHVISRWWHHLSRKSVKRSLSAQPCSEIPGGSEYRDTDETLAVSAKAAPKENGRA